MDKVELIIEACLRFYFRSAHLPKRATKISTSKDIAARGLLPENTIPVFLKTVELGVNTIELEVVVSPDGRAVVSHEPGFFFGHLA